MLQTNDIGVLFATLQAAYGHQWAHKADAIPVWQAKLDGFTPQEIMSAASEAIEKHAEFPPSVGQFLDILKAHSLRGTTYIEDLRPSGHMPYTEWKERHDKT